MPVSKKRKKDGKPARRPQATAREATGETAEHPQSSPPAELPRPKMGHPRNPFVAQQQSRRGAQRGR
jgi:hypothetical protein